MPTRKFAEAKLEVAQDRQGGGMNTVYTIGYEGTDIDRLIETLRAVDIRVLADVRAIALSRKKGFSKKALKSRLEAEGIEYQHFVDLGDPKPGREAARAGRYDVFRSIYAEHLATSQAKDALSVLSTLTSREATCLLCFERDPSVCHRSIVAARLKKQGRIVFDLYGDLPRRYDNFSTQQPRRHLGESASAA